MKKAIITGATSMIGLATLETCLRHGVSVIAVVRPGSGKIDRLPKSDLISIIECDISNYKELPEMIKETGSVFYHFAWKNTGPERNNDIQSQLKNIDYTVEALLAAKNLGAEAFIGAGSQAEYGIVDEGLIGPETPTNPITPYGICKYSAGRLALFLGEKFGIRTVWVRIFSVYGKYDKPTSMISQALRKMLNDQPTEFTQGIQLWDYLYSKDAGEAFYLIGEKGKEKSIYCLGSGNCRPLVEFLEILRTLTKTSKNLGLNEVPYKSSAVMNLCADTKKLEEDTNFKPRYNFQKAIVEMMNDF